MQLSSLVDRFAEVEDRIWVTVATPQTESLLAGEHVCWVGEAPTRDWRAVGQNAVKIRKLFRSETIDRAISTGSSLALSALPQAALRRIPTHYIESVTRTDGFSLSGRILQRIPGISLYTQWPHLATPRMAVLRLRARWIRMASHHTPSGDQRGRRSRHVRPLRLPAFARTPLGDHPHRRAGALADGVDRCLRTRHRRSDQPAAQELSAAIEAADAVVAHAGAGISLTALQAGKIPLLAPRLASQGEHVDDHQTEIARYLNKLDLAVVADADEVTWDLLTSMTARRAVAVAEPERFQLHE